MIRIPIALQLHSVRQVCEQDLAGTLLAVKAMGYDGVEFAGFFGLKPVTLRRMLAETNLRCAGAHIPFEDLLAPRLEETLIYQQALGNPNLVVPSLPEEYRHRERDWKEAALWLAGAGDRARAYGLRVGYHNHAFEFAQQAEGGRSFWDTFIFHCGKSIFLQLDSGNAAEAGTDIAAVIRRYPGRCKTVHLKEWAPESPDARIGEGEVAWERIFEACERVGETEWYIVEQRDGSFPPLESARRNLRYLRMMGRQG